MKGMAWRGRAGFKRIELVVVIALIVGVLGLLLPATVRVRDDCSFRSFCANNLRQIGIAFQTHHGDHGCFPSGGIDDTESPTYQASGKDVYPRVGAGQNAGWAFQILPYVEGTNAWNGGTATDIPNKQKIARATPNRVYFCPARRYLTVWHDDKSGNDYALCDYAASNLENNGVVQKGRTLRLAEITDGAAYTLLVADKGMDPNNVAGGALNDNKGYAAGWADDTLCSTDPGKPPRLDKAGQPADHRFGSLHPTRFMAVFCDDSVHGISDSIDPNVFSHLGNIADGNKLATSDDW